MFKLSTLWWPVLLLTLLASACSPDDDDELVTAEGFATMESEWVRLTLLDDDGIKLMQTNTGKVLDSVNVAMAEGAAYYTSNSGRYLTVIERANNRVRFFDSGVINHEDHGHQQKIGWLATTVEAPLPTHYTATGGEVVVFNDGDGSITYFNEAQLEIPNYRPRIFTYPTVAHHGAGFRLANGQFVTTFKNTTTPGGLPQMVKFLDRDGKLIDDNGGVEVTGIHGDATNGRYGVFGSTDGVILVDDKSNISLIPNAPTLKGESGFWLGTLKGHDNTPVFYGRAGKVGSFLIDPVAKTMRPLYTGDDIAGDMPSFNGAYYILHTKDTKVRVYDAKTSNLLAERTVDMVNVVDPKTGQPSTPIKDMDDLSKLSPVMVSSDRYLYILAPNRIDIQVLSIVDLEHVQTIKLNAPVKSIAKNGFTEV